MDKKEEYNEYLQSSKWKLKRLEKAKDVQYICELCGNIQKKRYEIHHRTYENFKNEKMSDLMFLCLDCHRAMHLISKKDRINLEIHLNGEIKKEKRKRTCENCKYSSIIKDKKRKVDVLFCNKKYEPCMKVCVDHFFGGEKNQT